MSLVAYWNAARSGKTVTFRPRGPSMRPLVPNGAVVVVEPCAGERLEAGDVVLVRVAGQVYLHKVLRNDGGRVLIGNNRGRVNGWTRYDAVAGICVSVNSTPRPGAAGKTRPAS